MTPAIQSLCEDRIDGARAVITEVCLEFFGRAPVDFEDMGDSSHYAPPSGTFMVLMDGDRVAGTGAIRRIDGETCELKRMWFLPAYRGLGHGTRMSEGLLAFARSAGYKRVKLDTSPILEAASRLPPARVPSDRAIQRRALCRLHGEAPLIP